MITCNITGFLTEFTGGDHQVVLPSPARTVGEALQQLWQLHSALRDRVLNERGEVRQHVNVFIDNENIRHKAALETPVNGDAEITILPAVSGGSI
jgi:molybdopterin converting factor small subunit